MTALATDPAGTAGTPGTPAPHRTTHRIVAAARLHAANPWQTLLMPWMIYTAIFAGTAGIYWLVMTYGNLEAQTDQEGGVNGGASWVLIYMMVMMVQAMNRTFRFALGMSLTRREYYLGTVAYFLTLAVGYASAFTALAAIERATDGWGLTLQFFAPMPLNTESLAAIWITWVALFALFMAIGAAVATIYVRWAATGLVTFFIALAAVIIGVIWVMVATSAGTHFVDWATRTTMATAALWSLPLSALWLAAGYVNLRRAGARN